ncbi:PAS domain S-box protein [Actinopolymorpha sp. B17G11]|uniref:PAS domain S-box protein n=1 Tax=unclassified Actinopolymorpha TaxID=2627063 RepID=UPI0032D8C4D5
MPTFPVGAQDPDERLRELEAMLNAITEYQIIKLDVSGNIASWNPGAEAVQGYSADEVLGQPVSMFYTEEDNAAGLTQRELQTARDTGRVEFEGWRVRKGGSRFWASVILAPIRDENGDVTGFVKVTRDETERREQEVRLQRQRDEILELSTPVIQVWDKVLVLPIIGTLDSQRAARLTEDLLEKIAENQGEVIILEVSGVPTIDTQVGQHLLKTVQAAALMGTVSILSGVRAEVAQSMVNLGVDLGQLRSRNTLRDALQLALQVLRDQPGAAGSGQTLGGGTPRE